MKIKEIYKREVKGLSARTKKIQGWVSNYEGRVLFKRVLQCTGKGAIVEIGSWKGKSTIWLGKGSQAGCKSKIYAIDPHTGSSEHRKGAERQVWTFDEFKQNIESAGLSDIVEPIVKTSREAAKGWDKPVEFLFIDGDHNYEAVREDFELWFPHLIDGGTIAIHDSTACLRHGLIGWPGPRKVVKEYIFRSRRFRQVDLFGTMVVARKCEANTLADRIRILAVRLWKTSPDTIHAVVWLLARNRFFKGLFTTAINKLLAFKGLPVRSA